MTDRSDPARVRRRTACVAGKERRHADARSSSVACSGPSERTRTSTASGYGCGRHLANARAMCRPRSSSSSASSPVQACFTNRPIGKSGRTCARSAASRRTSARGKNVLRGSGTACAGSPARDLLRQARCTSTLTSSVFCPRGVSVQRNGNQLWPDQTPCSSGSPHGVRGSVPCAAVDG